VAAEAQSRGVTGRGAVVTVVAQSATRGITLFVILASTALVTRAVGVDTYANWVTALSLMAMAGFLLDPGMSPVLVRRLLQTPDETPQASALLAPRLALAAGAALFAIGMTVALRGPDAAALAAVLAAQLLPRAFVMNVGAWLQADQRLHRQTVLEAVVAVLGLTGLAIATRLDAPATGLAAIGFLVPAIVLAVLMARELRLTPSSALPPGGPQRARVRSVLVEVAPLAASLLFVTAYTRIDVVFVNAAADAADVAAYLFAFQFIEQLLVLASIVGTAVLPLLAARARVTRLMEDPGTHTLLAGLAAVGALLTLALIAISVPLTRIVGGPELAQAAEPLQLLAPTAVVLFVAIPLGTVYLATAQARRYLYFNAAALVFNVVGNAALTLPYGIDAAARLTWATEGLVAAVASIPIWRLAPAAALRLAALVAIGIAASEATAAGAAPGLAALAGAIAVAVVAGRQIRTLVELALHRGAPVGAGAS
jgi:O-antigen/teichoic acid export membrane protein